MKKWKTKSNYTLLKLLGGRSNVFLLQAEGLNIMIDSGPALMWRMLNSRLKNLNISKIDYLILTHSHFDHAANACKLKKYYHARVIIHSSEANLLAKGENPEFPGTNMLSRCISGLGKKIIGLLNYQPCTFDFSVNSIFDLTVFNINAYILYTPGHTKGSVSLIVDNEIALVGDCMFGVFSNKIFPPFAEDVPLLLKSWELLIDHHCEIFLPAHGSARNKEQILKSLGKLKMKYNH